MGVELIPLFAFLKLIIITASLIKVLLYYDNDILNAMFDRHYHFDVCMSCHSCVRNFMGVPRFYFACKMLVVTQSFEDRNAVISDVSCVR